MATKTSSRIEVVDCEYADVVSFWDMNHARKSERKFQADTPQSKTLINSIMERGLYFTEGQPLVEPISKEMADRAVKEREELIATLRQQGLGSPEALQRLKVVEALYCDEKGKVRRPKYLQATWNRRNHCFLEAQIALFNRACKASPETANVDEVVQKDWSVQVHKFATPGDRLMAQIVENEGKNIGQDTMSLADRLYAARELVNAGHSQADLRRVYKDGMGQKLYHFICLDNRFPKLELFDRVLYDTHPKGAIPWGRLTHSGKDLRALDDMNRRSDPESLQKWNDRQSLAGKPTAERLTEADLEDRFQQIIAGTEPKVKAMKRDTIHNVSKNHAVEVVRKVAEGIANDKDQILKNVGAHAPLLNAAWALRNNKQVDDIVNLLEKFDAASDAKTKKAIDAAIKLL